MAPTPNVSLGLSKQQYVSFVKAMVESAVNNPAGGNYRLDNIRTTFAKDSYVDSITGGVGVTYDYTPITNYLEWNPSYSTGYNNINSSYARASLFADMTEALTDATCFFAVLVFGRVPIHYILNIYYPNNTLTEFVQCVVYAGTCDDIDSNGTKSSIYSDNTQSDGYGPGVNVDGYDSTAFDPYQYCFTNLRVLPTNPADGTAKIEVLPARITAIDMWAASSPTNWVYWLANATQFLDFITNVFMHSQSGSGVNGQASAGEAHIFEFTSTGTDGFSAEFIKWLNGDYNLGDLFDIATQIPINLTALYTPTYGTYNLAELDFDTPNGQYIYNDVEYNILNESNTAFVITVLTLLAADVSIAEILGAFPNESAPSFFYKGYMTAAYARNLFYVEGLISFSRLIANGDAIKLANTVGTALAPQFKSSNTYNTPGASVTSLDPYILLYDDSNSSEGSDIDFPADGSDNIFEYVAPAAQFTTTATIFDAQGSLIEDMKKAYFTTTATSDGGITFTTDSAPAKTANDIIDLIYRVVRMEVIPQNTVGPVSKYIVNTTATDSYGNPVLLGSLYRGRKIRLHELYTKVGYSVSDLKSRFLISDFVAENYSLKNSGASMKLYDVVGIYQYTISQLYNAVLAYRQYNTYANVTPQNVTNVLGELRATRDIANTTGFSNFDIIYYLCQANRTDSTDGQIPDISNIAKFFPAFTYVEIRAVAYGLNSSLYNTLTTNHISIKTLTDNGNYLKFLTASDVDINYLPSALTRNNNQGIYDILKSIPAYSAYTPTEIAYKVLLLPTTSLVITYVNPQSITSPSTLDTAFTNALRYTPIDLLYGHLTPATYRVFSKIELNGLYDKTTQTGVYSNQFPPLTINIFLPVAADYIYLLYGTNIGVDINNNTNGYGIRGILQSLNGFASLNPTNIAHLCLSLAYSSTNSTLVVPHDIGPNGTIKQSGNIIFNRREIRRLTFSDGTNGLVGPALRKTPSELVAISAWDTYEVGKIWYSGADYIHNYDYDLLNVNDVFTYDSVDKRIAFILHEINTYGKTTESVGLFKNIDIALNAIYMASDNLLHPEPYNLFDGGYYTRDEIRTLFESPVGALNQLTLSALTNNYNVNTNNALYKLAYATDRINLNTGYYTINGSDNTMYQILSNTYTSATDRAQIIRKMIYSFDFQNAAIDAKFHAQPWQLVSVFKVAGATVVRFLPAVTATAYVAYNNTSSVTLPAVESGILIPQYKVTLNYNATFNHEYKLYELNTVYGYNKDNDGNDYLTNIIGTDKFLDPSLSPRRLAVELRQGAFDGTSYPADYPHAVNNSYSLGDVVDALNKQGYYTNADYTITSSAEVKNKAIYITDYPGTYQSLVPASVLDSTANSTLYHATAVTMWTENDWKTYFIDEGTFTGKDLNQKYGFTFNQIRDYFFNKSNTSLFSTKLFLTSGTYMTNLLFTRDYPGGSRVAISLLTALYNDTTISFKSIVTTLAALTADDTNTTKSAIVLTNPNTDDPTTLIEQYLYYNTSDRNPAYNLDTQIYGEWGTTRATTIKDVEYARMGTISSSKEDVDIDIGPRSDMTDAFTINAMYNEVTSAVTGKLSVIDFFHYYNRTNLRDFIVGLYDGDEYPQVITSHPDISTVVDNTYGNSADFGMTIDYFTLNELATDASIPLSRVASTYYGAHTLNASVYGNGSTYGENTKIPYLYGKIIALNTRHPTGLELKTAGTSRNADWSILNIRKLYYSGINNNYAPATGKVGDAYITFKNLVGAVYDLYDVTNGTATKISVGDYSLVYAQDYDLKSDMVIALQGGNGVGQNAITVTAIKILYDGIGNNYVKKVAGNVLTTKLTLDEIRTIVGYEGYLIAGYDTTATSVTSYLTDHTYTAYTVAAIVSDADAGKVSTDATNNYWVTGPAYDSIWMTLKHAYKLTTIDIAQNSNVVIGTDLLNTGATNPGFTAADTRIGFFYNMYLDGANHKTSDVAFTKVIGNKEFTGTTNYTPITKFAQLVNYGLTSSINALDGNGYPLIPYNTLPISTTVQSSAYLGFYNLFKYLRAMYNAYNRNSYGSTYDYNDPNQPDNFFNYLNIGYLADEFDLQGRTIGMSGVNHGNLTGVTPTSDLYVKICMYIRFEITKYAEAAAASDYFSYYLNSEITTASPTSIIIDYYTSDTRASYSLMYMSNLFSDGVLFLDQTIPQLWLGGSGKTVRQIIETFELYYREDPVTYPFTPTYIFAAMYPYVPLELLLAYRTDTGKSNGNALQIPLGNPANDPSYEPGTRWISLNTALRGMDGKWGVEWSSEGYLYSDKNSDAPSIDQVLTALSFIDEQTYSYTSGANVLTKISPVVKEIRDAFLISDGAHPAICGYNAADGSITAYPTTTTKGGPGTNTNGIVTTPPTINQLVALVEGQNIPLGFAKLLFAPTVIIRASIYTRAEKRALFASNTINGANDGGLADAYYQLNLLATTPAYTGSETITAVANKPSSSNNTTNLAIYYTTDHVVSDLISLKFEINSYNNFTYFGGILNANTTSTVSGKVNIPDYSLISNPFTTYGLLTAYDSNSQGYDNDGYLISIQGQLIWHTTAERTNIIDVFEISDASEYKYNPDFSNALTGGPYGLDSTGNYYYAYTENLSNLQDVYRIEQRALYKADTRAGRGMSNDPNLNILIALKAIGVKRTIALKFPATAYSPFTNKNIGGELSSYSYTRGTNNQNSITTALYNPTGNTPNQRILNFTAYELLSAYTQGSVEADSNGYIFNNMDRLLWHTVQERDEIIEAFSNRTGTNANNILMYNPTNNTYGKDLSGHYYFSYPENMNDFGDLIGQRPTP